MSNIFFQTNKLFLASTYSQARQARMLVLLLPGGGYAMLAKDEVEALERNLKLWLGMEQAEKVQFEVEGEKLPVMKLDDLRRSGRGE